MKRNRNYNDQMGPAAAALRRRSVFRDARASSTQLTDAQLIAGALEMQRSIGPSNTSTTVVINSPEELALYRQKTRAELEERVKRGYTFLGNWVKYARWEAQQKDYERMRSILERAVKYHGANPVLWRDYAELEEEGGFINHARAVWERGVTALPSATDLWLKYIVLEQAAGQDGKVRDLFNRWVSGPTPPACAWELFALFEAQQRRAENCRDILRRYVEAHGTVECWIFYGSAELNVLKNADRAVMVYACAMESLPNEYINGEKDCRIPLAWADALAAALKFDEARELYHRLLKECTSVKALDAIFTAYKRFERLYGSAENHETMTSVIARAMYQHRIAHNPRDFDAYVAQFLLFRDATQGDNASVCAGHAVNVGSKGGAWEEALQCLTAAAGIRIDGEKDAVLAQHHAVVVMAYARLVEERGDVAAARSALAKCIRHFPFKTACCPRLWIEAAALEERHGEFVQAQKLLAASLNISPCPEVFDAALRLESNACAAGEVSAESCVHRSRAIYESAIKQFPQNFALWEGYAKLEEKERQFHRSDALRAACIRSFSAVARSVVSLSERYEVLEKVDQAWARRLALKRRLLRSARKKTCGGLSESAEVEELNSSLRQLYQELLDSVWDEYIYEALRWRGKNASTVGVLSPPPLRLPEVLTPATARWAEAVSAVTNFVVSSTTADGRPEDSSVEWMRTTFRERLERYRPKLLQEFGGLDNNASFEAIQQSKRWVEFLLSPNGTEWRRFEAAHGTSDTLEAAKECTQPTARRTRLFVRKKA
ncbi:hypothetical protein DPX39_100103700 [Trypanosoma brucei equiperdum]|uniref:Pre-mRNA-splicing factor Syf1-like N-terminal HAT-repeats domain-containing protein n=1 Tax=Trypanosoma brucei equiperdum TaxID=630700 RepID=A0A3L6L5W2_9TRYP|nr:hypothetical protein DPX39_100103700 [Trypanosoma brucei equiperdum]